MSLPVISQLLGVLVALLLPRDPVNFNVVQGSSTWAAATTAAAHQEAEIWRGVYQGILLSL